MKLTLRQLRYAVIVARYASISQAAERLNVTQPAISAAINELEEIVGQAIFSRQRGSGVSKTAFGCDFIAQATQLLEQASQLEQLAGHYQSVAGTLVAGCFEDLAPYCLPALMSATAVRYPQLQIDIRIGGFDDLARMFNEGGLDLMLSYDLAQPFGARQRRLCELPAHAILAAEHPLAELSQLSLRQLAEYPLILTDQAYSAQHFLDLFRQAGIRPQQMRKVHSFELQRGLIANQLGVGIGYTRPFGDHSYDGKTLAIRPISDPLPVQYILSSSRATLQASAGLSAFEELAADWFAEQSWLIDASRAPGNITRPTV